MINVYRTDLFIASQVLTEMFLFVNLIYEFNRSVYAHAASVTYWTLTHLLCCIIIFYCGWHRVISMWDTSDWFKLSEQLFQICLYNELWANLSLPLFICCPNNVDKWDLLKDNGAIRGSLLFNYWCFWAENLLEISIFPCSTARSTYNGWVTWSKCVFTDPSFHSLVL